MRTDLAGIVTEHEYDGSSCDHCSVLYGDCDDCCASGIVEDALACRASYCEWCFLPIHTHRGESLVPELIDHNYDESGDE